jgi:4-carboxymuconolactone decarboxylase
MNQFFSSQLPDAFPDAGSPERIGVPLNLDAEQRAAADELINGPRGGVYGPFRPLLHRPSLLRAIAKAGESLRYEGSLDASLREWTICVVARETSNVFEWDMHLPLAAKAGVPEPMLEALALAKDLPPDTPADLALALTLARELLADHRLTDETYARATQQWSEATLVELTTLVGYFAAVCWLMNVARTPGPTPLA